MRKTALVCLLIIFGAPCLSFAEQPLEALQRGVEEGIRVLLDPRYQDASRKKLQQQKLWQITQQIFDFKEFSRRVLASYWKKFTPQQRKEFVKVFSEFLGKFYLSRLQKGYRDERVIYVSQQMIGKSRAMVKIKVLWKKLEVPVNLRMTKRSGTWKVYDLSILGVSAVKNYRAQFRWILRKQSPAQVIARLKEKIEALDAKAS